MTETNKRTDNLLNAINDGDKELALKLAQGATAEQISHEHLSAAIKLYEESTSNIASVIDSKISSFLDKQDSTKNKELIYILIKKASDQALSDVKSYNPPKTIEDQIDEELGDKEIDHRGDRVRALIYKFANHEIRERKGNKLAQDDPLLYAIKGSDKYKALELIGKAADDQIKPEHLAAAIEEYYQGSGEMVASTVRSTEGSIVKALAKKSSDEALLNNQKHEIKSAVYEHSEDGMPTIDKVSDAEYVEVKAVIAELNRRNLRTSNHTSAEAQRTSNTTAIG